MPEENRSFLKRVDDGEFNVKLASFLNSRPLSEQEIKELKWILNPYRD